MERQTRMRSSKLRTVGTKNTVVVCLLTKGKKGRFQKQGHVHGKLFCCGKRKVIGSGGLVVERKDSVG